MGYAILAGLVVALHLTFVAFVLGGGLLALRWRWMPWLHLPAAAWGALIELTGGVCPLTPLENRLRVAAGASAYEGDFVDRYLMAVLYPDGLTRTVQMELAALVVAINLVVYFVVWRRYSPSLRLK